MAFLVICFSCTGIAAPECALGGPNLTAGKLKKSRRSGNASLHFPPNRRLSRRTLIVVKCAGICRVAMTALVTRPTKFGVEHANSVLKFVANFNAGFSGRWRYGRTGGDHDCCCVRVGSRALVSIAVAETMSWQEDSQPMARYCLKGGGVPGDETWRWQQDPMQWKSCSR